MSDRMTAPKVGQPPHPSGADHPCWRGDQAGYVGLHARVRKARGKADHCTVPGCTTVFGLRTFHWANLTGHYEDVMDYAAMCATHHAEFDQQGLKRSGEKNCNARLTEAIVREARQRHARGMTGKALAAEYGVAVTTMCRALRGKTWGWLK
jgi:hypothetical protein